MNDPIFNMLKDDLRRRIDWRERYFFNSTPPNIPSLCREASTSSASNTDSGLTFGIFTIDVHIPDEKELIQDEINKLLYQPGAMLVFADAAYDANQNKYSGAITIYLANKTPSGVCAKLRTKFVRGYADHSIHAEVLTACAAMEKSEGYLEDWFRNELRCSSQYELPSKIVLYCDNIVPVNIFRWAKHNYDYYNDYYNTRRQNSRRPPSQNYERSMKKFHDLVKTAFDSYFTKPCNHMRKLPRYSRHHEKRSYMYILIPEHRNQLRTDTNFRADRDCFDDNEDGFDVRHCPAHRGVQQFDRNDVAARRDLRSNRGDSPTRNTGHRGNSAQRISSRANNRPHRSTR